MEIFLRKKLEKTNNNLVVKINQTQAHHSCKQQEYKSAKIKNTTEKFLKQKLELYSEFVSKNI